MRKLRILAGIVSAVGLAAAGASADPRGGASLAAPGACAQPDPDLVTETVQPMPSSVSGRPTDDFSPSDRIAELVDKTTAGVATNTASRSSRTSTLGTLVDGALGVIGIGSGATATSPTGGSAPAPTGVVPSVSIDPVLPPVSAPSPDAIATPGALPTIAAPDPVLLLDPGAPPQLADPTVEVLVLPPTDPLPDPTLPDLSVSGP